MLVGWVVSSPEADERPQGEISKRPVRGAAPPDAAMPKKVTSSAVLAASLVSNSASCAPTCKRPPPSCSWFDWKKRSPSTYRMISKDRAAAVVFVMAYCWLSLDPKRLVPLNVGSIVCVTLNDKPACAKLLVAVLPTTVTTGLELALLNPAPGSGLGPLSRPVPTWPEWRNCRAPAAPIRMAMAESATVLSALSGPTGLNVAAPT